MTMAQSLRSQVGPNDLVVFGTDEHASFDPIWQGDQDWALSLEPI